MIMTQRLVPTNKEALLLVLREWKARWPAMGVLALLPEKESTKVPILQAVTKDEGVSLLGAVFPLLIADGAFRDGGVLLLCFEEMPGHFLIPGLSGDGRKKLTESVAALIADTAARESQRPTLLTIFDAMVPDIGSLMDDMHLQLPSPPWYVGANAGSESFQPMPCLFDREQIVGDAVLGLMLADQLPAIVKHDYPVSKTLMRATSATGNRIVTINNRPAFDVYQEIIGAEYGVALTRENFYQYAVHFPFGVVMAVDVLVRIPVALDDDGSLVCVGEIPPDSMLRMLKAPELAQSTCVTTICNMLENRVVYPTPFNLLTFYCAGRRMHFSEHADAELKQLQQDLGSALVFGALSLGEIDSNEDFDLPRFHNAAMVCLPQKLT